ncbi:cyclin-dependent kinase G-2 isoform X1 [Cinnamomum micranthum f. kanehirae]|uniref:cyclin-dependent kinase n=1 Tax=Cinnamomum micranthum f. kanehirae TaxID=337451 RepID=A0A443Q1L3_9MAGN|nr:cyclin-dependent kinase G-2 isoform X1 [Cinnamomum micranthum f. kanehirae]
MAAGRHGGYRKNEFRDRELDVNLSRRRDFYYFVEDCGRYGKVDSELDRSGGGPELERGKVQGYEDRVRSKQRDVREREVVNGGYHSSSSTNDSGISCDSRKRRRSPVKMADREPGELSSGSGSDDAERPELQVEENEDLKPQEGTWFPVAGKRKFSPIVWDREEKRVSNSSRNKTKIVSHHPHIPQVHSSQPSSVKPSQTSASVVSVAMDLSARDSLASGPKEDRSNGQELGKLEEDDDYVPTWNISASRWANGIDSPRDEGEFYDDEQVIKRKEKMHGSDLVSVKLKSTLPSPEAGEFMGDSCEGSQAKSTDSDGEGHRVGSASEVEHTDIDFDRNDMEIDSEDVNHSVDGHQTETHSEENSHETLEPLVPSQRSINMLQGCRSVHKFEKLNRIDEGTYGVVFRAKDKKSGEIVALKKVKMEKEREGFPLTSLREINILLSLHHPSIVDVKEVVAGDDIDSIFMVMEYMEHDLKGLMETMRQPFSQSEVKCLMKQLLEGVKYLHDNWVLHRDLKTSNILFNNRGELKICDFGLSRQYGSPLKPYTPLVVTLWYRAPELLLGAKQYSTAIDMWSLGCIMAELLAKEPLFNGKSEFDQLDKIYKTLGTPNEKIWSGFGQLPGVKVNFVKQPYNKLREKFPPTSFSGRPALSEAGLDLLNKLLTYNPEKRITAADALEHDWFREVPLPKSKDFMPTFPAQHSQDRTVRRLRRIMKSPDPLEELRRKEAQQPDVPPDNFGWRKMFSHLQSIIICCSISFVLQLRNHKKYACFPSKR